jgi:diguanylate cyclase (GGDEF)-like protein/PAS domain S-box-containing protein
MAHVFPLGTLMGEKNNGSRLQQEFGALLDAAPDAMIIIDAAGTILAANTFSERIFGYRQTQLVGLSVEQLLPERFRDRHVSHRMRFAHPATARPMGSGRVDLFGLRADGSEFPVEISLKPLEIGGKKVVAAAVRDITLRQRTEDKLRVLSTALENKHASLQAVLDSLTEGVLVFSLDGQVLDANPAAIRMYGAKNLHQVLKTFHDFALDFHVCGFDGTHLPVEQWPFSRVARGETVSNVELEVWSKGSGQRMFISFSGAPIRDKSGQPVLGVCTMRDITEHKQAEDRIRRASLHDALTGLPNRTLLFEYSRHVFASTRRNQHNAAVLFVDLDRFKPINDLHGHEVGDAVLKEVAQRLTASTRQEDIAFRLGGDEFLLILPDIADGAYAGTVANHLVQVICQPYHVDELELSLSASIGISVYPRDSDDIDTLINQADIAMYHAKHSGRGCYQFYSAALNERLNAKNMIERHLKTALMECQFQLYYQPVVDISTGDVLSVEALLRWPHAEIGPERFIPVAEATGMIGRLGEWVLVEACRQHNLWIDNGLPAIPIAVNVSAVQFCQPNFVSLFCKAMEGCYANPKAITVEVTETALMGDIELAISQLSELRSLGIKVALDDFGTGYSSLNYLSRLPIDKLKVDKSFIYRIEHDTASRTITEAIIALGHTLHLEIVAEGIESVNVLEYLHSHGCDQAQGHHICEPVNARAFESWYRKHGPHAPYFTQRNDCLGRQKHIGRPN